MTTVNQFGSLKKYHYRNFPIDKLFEQPIVDFPNENDKPLLKNFQTNILKHHNKAFTIRDKADNAGFSCGSYVASEKFEIHEDRFDAWVEDLEVKAGMRK
jgi:hypothetical protein